MNDEKLAEAVRMHSHKLAEMSRNLIEMHFSYKVEEKPSKQYWEGRIAEFEQYTHKGIEYYAQVRYMIGLVDKKESQMFLLRMSKMHQLSASLAKTIEEVAANPSIMDPKDRQQSKWSRDVRDRLIRQSDECLCHEKDMNRAFREFYEKNLDVIAKV